MSNNLINNSVISNDKEKKEDQFDRSLGYWDLSFAGYSLIVGAGIFTLMPFIINNAKGYSWLAFIIGGFISVLTGFSFIRLNMEYPVNDAEYSWFLGIIGDKKQPENSFRNKLAKGGAAVLIWIVMLCVIAAIATVSAGMKDFIHLLGIKMNSYVLIFLAIFVPTFINIVGTKYTSGLNQIIMTGITLLFAFVIGIAIKNHKYIGEINFFNKPAKQNVSNIAKAAFMSIFAFNGFQALVQMSEETKNPANISKAMATSISFSTIVYVLISISIISIIGLSSSAKNGAPLSQAFATVIGKRGGDITTLMCIICMFSTILFSLLGGSRLLKNFAEIGIAPRFLKKISSLPQFLTGKSNSSNNKSIENYENKQIESRAIIITSDCIGKGLYGDTLMQEFLDSMLVQQILPSKIIFINKGVKLTCADSNSATIKTLKKIEDKGINILVSLSSLEELELQKKHFEDKLFNFERDNSL